MTDAEGVALAQQRPQQPNTQGRLTVGILSLAQALAMTGVSIVTLTTGLAGAYLSDNPAFATVPMAAQYVATMFCTYPAAMLMRHYGRRFGFTLGQAFGFLGACLSAYALLQQSFALFLAAGVLLGVHNAFWGFYRFAAAEAADAAFKARAISLVMAGGVLAAFAGPELAKLTRNLLAPVLFAGCYTVVAALCVANIGLLQFGRLPGAPAAAPQMGGRTWQQLLQDPRYLAAVAAGMASYGVMVLVMAATPLSMADCGLTFDDSAFVIEWHLLAMFTPSFFTGALIQRLGTTRIILIGFVLNAICMIANLSGTTLLNFWVGLVALGFGWNFMYVGATNLLTDTYRPEERDTAQATNDTMVFAAIALATFASGALQQTWGWAAVNAIVALPLVFAGVAMLGLRAKPRPQNI
ncbi:MAG: MFS transporter [Rhodospirillaceae bacterium]|nr:MFS transporter [Rhodospirillaceae bacterium]